MITFNNVLQEDPYIRFNEEYLKATNASQKNIEAINISSFDPKKNEVNSRFVNLKIIDLDSFIFFTNYESAKSEHFKYHDQIAATIFWESINVQIRIKAKIKKTTVEYNNKYFKARLSKKNALAISSKQSMPIISYEENLKRYKYHLESSDLTKCPNYWGGYTFTPYYFEYWEGHESRINKREIFEKDGKGWHGYFLQP